jgi:hypothetical protein
LKKIALAALLAVQVAGCATSSGDIRGSYVSPLQYNTFSCPQIAAEASRVAGRAAELAGVQDANRSNDQVAAGVGIVLFWPALFFMKGDGQNAAELARLKGEYEALERASIEKNCNMKFSR